MTCSRTVLPCASVVLLVSILGVAAGLPGFAEERAPRDRAEGPAAETNSIEAQVAALATLPLDKLRAKAQEIEESIPKLAATAQELAGEVRELRIAAQESEAVKAVRAEMAELQKKLERVIDEIPEVKAKTEEASKAKAKLFQHMQLRTRVLALIAAAERKAAEQRRAIEGDPTERTESP